MIQEKQIQELLDDQGLLSQNKDDKSYYSDADLFLKIANMVKLNFQNIISEKSLLPPKSTQRQQNLTLIFYKLSPNSKAKIKVVKEIKIAQSLMLNSLLNFTRFKFIDLHTEISYKFQQEVESLASSQQTDPIIQNENFQDFGLLLRQLVQWVGKVQENSADCAISVEQNTTVPPNFLQGTLLCTIYHKLCQIKNEKIEKNDSMKLVIFNLTGIDYKENIEYFIDNTSYSGYKYISFMPFDEKNIKEYSKIKKSPLVTLIPYEKSNLDSFQLNFFYEAFLKQELMHINRQSVIVILLSSTQKYCLPTLQTIIRKTVVNKQHVFVHIDALIPQQFQQNSMDIEEDNESNNNFFLLINATYSAFTNQKIHKIPTLKTFKYDKIWINNTLSHILGYQNLTISQKEVVEGYRHQQIMPNQKQSTHIEPNNTMINDNKLKTAILNEENEITRVSINLNKYKVDQIYVDYENKLIVGYFEKQIFYCLFDNYQKLQQVCIVDNDMVISNPTIFTVKQYIIVAFGIDSQKKFIPYIYVIDTINNNYTKCIYQQVEETNLIRLPQLKDENDKKIQKMIRVRSAGISQIIGQNYQNVDHWIKRIQNRRNPGISKQVLFEKEIDDEENTLCFMFFGGESEKNEIMNIVECFYIDLNTKQFESYIIEKQSISLSRLTLQPIYPESSKTILVEQITESEEALVILPGTQSLDYKFNCPLNNQQQNSALVYLTNREQKRLSITNYKLIYNDIIGHDDLKTLYQNTNSINRKIQWCPNKNSKNIKKIIKNNKIYWVMLNNYILYNQNLIKEGIIQNANNNQISIAELFDRLLITIIHVNHELKQIDITIRISENSNQSLFIQPRIFDTEKLDTIHQSSMESTRDTFNLSIDQSVNQSIKQGEGSDGKLFMKQVKLSNISF